MKLINAEWEKKNFKKNTIEFIVESTDRQCEVEKAISSLNCEYAVVKIPCRKPDLINYLTENGYIFAETQISLYKNLTLNKVSNFDKFLINFNLAVVKNSNELEHIILNFENDMFSTDRIALDSRFGIEIANTRYKNWLTNELENKNSEIFRILKKDKDIGFLMTKRMGSEVNILLGGIYTKFHNFGYGPALVYKPIDYYTKVGLNILRTKTSSNNQDIVKFYISAGYQIENFEYVFVRHLN